MNQKKIIQKLNLSSKMILRMIWKSLRVLVLLKSHLITKVYQKKAQITRV